MKPDIAPQRYYYWVSSKVVGLAHLSTEEWEFVSGLCGSYLGDASERKAEGKARCSICAEIVRGEIEAYG